MKKTLFFAVMTVAVLASCNKIESTGSQMKNELSFIPMNETKGYTTETAFSAIAYENLHDATPTSKARDMKLSAYLYPQNGEQGNYFVGNTYSQGTDNVWHNFVKGTETPIYWPVGGTMDFLAYSVSQEKNLDVVWDADNAASQVVLTVPAENTQNDILFASVSGEKSRLSATPVNMTFNHAQAWLEFQVKSTTPGIVKFDRIEIENIYNAGKLTIDNNGGNAKATWDFSAEARKTISVDDNYDVKGEYLTNDVKFLDMLLPNQDKNEFVIYYTLGTDTQELSYRFTTDNKTWLMGEKYVYQINITSTEVTVDPSVVNWTEKTVFSDTLY